MKFDDIRAWYPDLLKDAQLDVAPEPEGPV